MIENATSVDYFGTEILRDKESTMYFSARVLLLTLQFVQMKTHWVSL